MSSEQCDPISVIATKRDGARLSDTQIEWVIDAYTGGRVAAEQMSALLMAIVLRGMDTGEIATWTAAMINSGTRMDFTGLRRGQTPLTTVDKHSTGGVGDKITLPLAPLVASFGVAVPQLSGRGLGHTGGTLDKLESIAGWRADLSMPQMVSQLEAVGAVVCAASPDLAPADRLLYALRDVTGTVESIPLIASSIMSKKIAEGTGALVLDVKVGSGAFLPELSAARELAATMVELGERAGVTTSALLTDMDTPLGRAAGNAVEVAESLEVLAGGGPADVVDLTVELAREMLTLAGLGELDPAVHLRNGKAMDTWRAMIAAQGGDPDARLPRARHTEAVTAEVGGYVRRVDARAVGDAAWRLGAGRSRPGDSVQAEAGVLVSVAPGDRVTPGTTLFALHTQTPERLAAARAALADAVELGETPISVGGSRVIERVRFGG